MTNTNLIKGTPEAWDERLLGAEEQFVESVELDSSLIDTAIGLKPISIRLQTSMIEELKEIATLHGLGYQPLIRQILSRFIECEKKRILREEVSRIEKEAAEEEKKIEARQYA